MKYLGLILKVNDNNAFVITNDCKYYQIKRSSEMFNGQKVEFGKSDIINLKNAKSHGMDGVLQKKLRYAAAVAAVFLVMVSAFILWKNSFIAKSDIYAYIDVDINPSLEIAIDSQNNIKEVRPLNNEAKTLIKGINIKKILLKDALSQIVSKSMEYGFLNKDKKDMILISAAINEQKSKSESINNLISNICSDVKKLDAKNISTTVVNIQPETRELAVKNDISMGRFVIFEEARKSGMNLSIESVRKIPLEAILDKVDLKGVEINSMIDIVTETAGDKPSAVSAKGNDLNPWEPSKDNFNLFAVKENKHDSEKNKNKVLTNNSSLGQNHTLGNSQTNTPVPEQTPPPVNPPSEPKVTDNEYIAPSAPSVKSVNISATPEPTPSVTDVLPTLPKVAGSISVIFNTNKIKDINQVIYATVEIKNMRKFYGYQLNLKYDPQVLQPVTQTGGSYTSISDPEWGTVLRNWDYEPNSFAINNLNNGRILLNCAYTDLLKYKNSQALESDGTLATFKFKVIKLKDTKLVFQNSGISPKEKSGSVLVDWDGSVISDYEVIQPCQLTVDEYVSTTQNQSSNLDNSSINNGNTNIIPPSTPTITPAKSAEEPLTPMTETPTISTETPSPTTSAIAQTPTSTVTLTPTPTSTVTSTGPILTSEPIPTSALAEQRTTSTPEPITTPTAEPISSIKPLTPPTTPDIAATPFITSTLPIVTEVTPATPLKSPNASVSSTPAAAQTTPSPASNMVNNQGANYITQESTVTMLPTQTPAGIIINDSIQTPANDKNTQNIFDINHDGRVNLEDKNCISKSFNKSEGESGYNDQCDLNKDKAVNFADQILFDLYFDKVWSEANE
ncbi:MAG: cohesin domain-containing protein, partial [Bacillota bacterium]|nr:cohesin domain-containing protein [Bacillota bacterium]